MLGVFCVYNNNNDILLSICMGVFLLTVWQVKLTVKSLYVVF